DPVFTRKHVRFLERGAVEFLTPLESLCIQPSVNRSGDKVIYVALDSFSATMDNDPSAIVMLDMASKTTRALIRDGQPNRMPYWHPDGNKLLYVSGTGRGSKIYEADTAGADPTCLTDWTQYGATASWNDPCWNNDGTEILCVVDSIGRRDEEAVLSRIVTIDPRQRELHVWTESRSARFSNPVYVDKNTILATKIAKAADGSETIGMVTSSRKGKLSAFKDKLDDLTPRPPAWGGCYIPSQRRFLYNSIATEMWGDVFIRDKKNYLRVFVGRSLPSRGDTTHFFAMPHYPEIYRRTWSTSER
ncbi:hypothetical protein EG831_05595, partial [bacterium]|nr:hypothetical protein [bacterium]